MTNEEFFLYHNELKGYTFKNKSNNEIPKFILFWNGYKIEDLLQNNIKGIKRTML